MSHLWVLLAAMLAVGECRRAYSGDEVTTNCANRDVDAYLDKIIGMSRTELDDPMRLPPKSTFVELSDGVLWGMSELTRVGPADVTCDGDNTVTIKAKLTTDELKGRYTWTKERKGHSDREGYIVFICDDFEASITLVIEKKKNEETHPRLERFVISKFKETRIEMTGMGFFTWAFAEMTTLVSGIFQRSIASTVQEPIREALERKMREISLHD